MVKAYNAERLKNAPRDWKPKTSYMQDLAPALQRRDPRKIVMPHQTTMKMFKGGAMRDRTGAWMEQEGFPNILHGMKGGPSARNMDVQKYSDEFMRYWGAKYMQGGALGIGTGAYIYGNAGGGNNYAYDSYMAQMRTSSNYGAGGQDLYVENAYIESNNFQDLFYNSDNLGT
tara:strand:- start:197 stop:712 length:516 start_codon:yes stop_codon:yes gene_type:complete